MFASLPERLAMHRLAWCGLFGLALAAAARADSPDPASLAVPPDKRARAEALVRQLGSEAFRERDRATRELYQMGRLALDALYAAREAADPEVRTRVTRLLPRAEADDLRARVDTFLADREGKFTHDLPGWHRFKALAGDDKSARALFADIVRNKENHPLLLAVRDADGDDPTAVGDLARALTTRRSNLRMQATTPLPGGGMAIRQVVPDPPDVALLLVAETVVPEQLAPPAAMQFQPSTFFYNTGSQEALNGTGKYGEAFRRLTVRWLESRDGPSGAMVAVTVAQRANLGEKTVARYAARLLGMESPQPYYKANAATILARHNGKEYVHALTRAFDDESKILFGNNQPDVQIRDVALAMALLVTGQSPKDYGFGTHPSPNEAMKFTYTYHRFLEDESQTADAKRAAAFAKWKAWEAAVYGAAAGPAGAAAGFAPKGK